MALSLAVGTLLGGLLGAGVNAAAGFGQSALQNHYQTALNKESYGYTKKLAQQSFGFNKYLQQQSYDLSKQLQNFQNKYTTKMASTAHQIEVADLRKAGLNPILSATGGNGASFSTGGATVGGSSVGAGSVSSGNAGMADIGDMTSAIQGYLNVKQTEKDIELAGKQKENLSADTYLKGNQANTESERFNTQVEVTKDIQNQIKNRDVATAAQADYYRSLGSATLMDAVSKRLEATANAYYQTHRALGKSESHGNGYGLSGGFDWTKKSGSIGGNYSDNWSKTW